MKRHLLLFYLNIFLFLSVGNGEEVKLITSVNSEFTTIHEETIRNLYLGREKFVENKLVEIVENKKAHNRFLKLYVRKDKRAYAGIWRMMVFTGKSLAPKEFDSEESLLEYIAKNKNVIGYTIEEVDDPRIIVINMIK